jgi:hypothetical protein
MKAWGGPDHGELIGKLNPGDPLDLGDRWE